MSALTTSQPMKGYTSIPLLTSFWLAGCLLLSWGPAHAQSDENRTLVLAREQNPKTGELVAGPSVHRAAICLTILDEQKAAFDLHEAATVEWLARSKPTPKAGQVPISSEPRLGSLTARKVALALLLTAAHGSAGFDAWATRRAMQIPGAREPNPLVRPFARSGMIYAATQGDIVVPELLMRRLPTKWRWLAYAWIAGAAEMHVRLGLANLHCSPRAIASVPSYPNRASTLAR